MIMIVMLSKKKLQMWLEPVVSQVSMTEIEMAF